MTPTTRTGLIALNRLSVETQIRYMGQTKFIVPGGLTFLYITALGIVTAMAAPQEFSASPHLHRKKRGSRQYHS